MDEKDTRAEETEPGADQAADGELQDLEATDEQDAVRGGVKDSHDRYA
jgi:hypothetical protein